MAIVVNLDPARRFGQFKQVRNLLQQLALRRALRQSPVQRLFGVARGLFDKPHTVATLRHADFNLALGAFGQCLSQQIRFGQFAVEQYVFGGRHVFVKLRKEAGEHLILGHFGHMGREKRTMPPILPAADEKRLNTHHAVAVRQGKDIGIANALRINRLRPLNEGQRLQPVAQHGRTFEIERFGRALHFLRQLCLHIRRFAVEEGFGICDQPIIRLVINSANAWRGAALDLIQQAWPVAIVEKTVRTAAQQKQLLQRIQRLVDRPRAGKGAVIMPLVPPCTAMFLDTREFMIRTQQDEGEAFVVAQQHVVSRTIALDQLRLQQQGFRLAIGGHNRHRTGQRDHSAQAIGQAVNLHIIADAVLQRPRLADI